MFFIFGHFTLRITYFGGSAVTPFEFVLPNAKLAFRTPGCFEISNAKSIETLMQDSINLPVLLILDDYYIRNFFLSKGVYTKKYLKTYDKVFREALEALVISN
ncbi:MAG: hypothetical protein RRX93_08265 [Bacteroidales bacterium]